MTFHDSTFIEVGVNPNVEVIRTLVSDQQPPQHPGPAGPLRVQRDTSCCGDSNAAAPLAFNTRYSIGDFYDGYRRGYTFGTTVRANEHFNVSGNVQFNDIDLPQGAFTTTLITGRVNYFLNTKVFAQRAAAIQHRCAAVELERPVQRHPSPAERHLPRLQRAARLAQRGP